jgi:aryl-alcohol dehydrogenase-like predicted oxidoreductase
MMQKRNLSQTLSVSAIGYGAMGLSEFYGSIDDTNSLAVLNKLIELDVTLIDTADLYGRGHNEKLIGQFLASLDQTTRRQFRIATKCGIERRADQAYARRINNDPEYITRCCHASLQRLGIEQIDLFYLHRVDHTASIEESMQCLAKLNQEGKIGHVGLCEVSAATLRKAHTVFPVTALQTEYSLWTRDIESDILPTLKELDIGLIPYSPLGRGFLTGRYTKNSDFQDGDFRKNNERFHEQNLQHNLQLVDAIHPLVEKYHCKPGQIALAWLLAQYEKIVPIPGTKKVNYLVENAEAANLLLDKEDIETLNNILNHMTIKGNRYSTEGMKGINA